MFRMKNEDVAPRLSVGDVHVFKKKIKVEDKKEKKSLARWRYTT